MGLALKPYQLETVDFAYAKRYAILGLEMGLGKSLCTLATWQKRNSRLIVVCPAYLTLNWEMEIQKWFPDKKLRVKRVKSGTDLKFAAKDFDVVIISYQLAQKAEFLFQSKKTFLVLDEAQNLSSMQAKRTEFIHRVVYENSIEDVLLLTGTPIKNRVQEFYSLLALCYYNPKLTDTKFLDEFPDSITFADYFSYRYEKVLNIGNRHVKTVSWKGVKNLDLLKRIIKPMYIRFESKDVLDLPPYLEKEILIQEKADKKLLALFEKWDETADSVASQYKAEAALDKAPVTVNYVKGLLEEVDSVVIYTDHVASAHAIAKAFNVRAITGDLPVSARMVEADKFQRGITNVIVATIGSFSTGVNLTRASNLVYNDLPWVPALVKQSMYRIIRIGQKERCTIHYIFGSPCDRQIKSVLKDKMETIELVSV